MQAKLLRALEERRIERLGGNESIPVDVRIVSATHRPLEQEINNGNFRADLFYRLRVVTVDIAAPARAARRHPGARRSRSRARRPNVTTCPRGR